MKYKECEVCHKHLRQRCLYHLPTDHWICKTCHRNQKSIIAREMKEKGLFQKRMKKPLLNDEEKFLYRKYGNSMSQKKFKEHLKKLNSSIKTNHNAILKQIKDLPKEDFKKEFEELVSTK